MEKETGAEAAQGPDVPCEWCGMFSAPGAICEVCGSPLRSGAPLKIDPENAGAAPDQSVNLPESGSAPGEEGSVPGAPSPSIRSTSPLMAVSEELASLASLGNAPGTPAEPTAGEPDRPALDLGFEPLPHQEDRPAPPPNESQACSRCGRSSEERLCEACREAFRQLQDLSLGLSGDEA